MHAVTSLGWLGAVVVFLVLALAALRGDDPLVMRAACLAMDLAVRFAIVPLAVASLLSGVVSSLVSPWGLVRHWWVLIKLAIVVVATAVLIMQVEPVAALADATVASPPTADGMQWREAVVSLVVHAVGGLVILLTATVLAIYKPRGATGFAARGSARRHRTGGAAATNGRKGLKIR
ncbi:DUF2269 domain-containing protein [Micromonospora sp. NPDC000442]|uniref:DUF2269 domain-containing protein n=1 Tax=Micromonospora sp. NPDC000442 TaxID=3364217 RepID=UPI0036738FB3